MNMHSRSPKPVISFIFLTVILSCEVATAQYGPDFGLTMANNVMGRLAAADYAKRIKKSKQHEFVIVFKNDSIVGAKGSVEHIHDIFVITIGKNDRMRVVKPEQTKIVSRKMSDGMRMSGIPFDKGWIFRTNSGPIYTYSFYPEAIEKEDDIVAIQKGDGPLVLFTVENLVAMMEPGSKAHSLAQKGDRYAIYLYNVENQRK